MLWKQLTHLALFDLPTKWRQQFQISKTKFEIQETWFQAKFVEGITCWYCGIEGHLKCDCRKKNRDNSTSETKTNTTQHEYVNSALGETIIHDACDTSTIEHEINSATIMPPVDDRIDLCYLSDESLHESDDEESDNDEKFELSSAWKSHQRNIQHIRPHYTL